MKEMKESKTRSCYFDNVKAILILLVVFGHLLEGLRINDFISSIYNFIYLFHMPLFILISGYFSKKAIEPQVALKKSMSYLRYYLVFQVLYLIFRYYVLGEGIGHPFQINLFTPSWILWYLAALILWTLVTPYIGLIRHKSRAIALSFVISIFSGFLIGIGYYLSISRFLVFLPFFVIGLCLTEKQMLNINHSAKIPMKIIASFIFIAVLFFMINSHDFFLDVMLYGATPFATLLERLTDYTMIQLFIQRILALLIAIVLGFCVLLLTPKRKLFITFLGENTLFIFLIHGFFVLAFNKYIAQYMTDANNVVILLTATIATIIITLICVLIGLLFKAIVTYFKPKKREKYISQSPSAESRRRRNTK